MTIRADLRRAAEHAANGCDVDHFLDCIAARALVEMFPAEVPDLGELYARRRKLRNPIPEHVVDALVLAVAEREVSDG